MEFIVVTHGYPYSTQAKPSGLTHLRRRDVIHKSWLSDHLFNSEAHFQYCPNKLPSVGSFSNFLWRTIYNPIVPVDIQWERIGDFSNAALTDAVQRGLETDDDIIQQWFDGDQVIRMLEYAKNWDETVLAVATISGAHEVDERSLDYVHSVLGRGWDK